MVRRVGASRRERRRVGRLLLFQYVHGIVPWGEGRRVDRALWVVVLGCGRGRRKDNVDCRGRHRAARPPQAAVVVLGFVAGDMYDKESESDSCLCVYVCVGRGLYVESKEACVNWHYTSSISSPNRLGIPGSIRSSTTSHCSSRGRAGSTARITHPLPKDENNPEGP